MLIQQGVIRQHADANAKGFVENVIDMHIFHFAKMSVWLFSFEIVDVLEGRVTINRPAFDVGRQANLKNYLEQFLVDL